MSCVPERWVTNRRSDAKQLLRVIAVFNTTAFHHHDICILISIDVEHAQHPVSCESLELSRYWSCDTQALLRHDIGCNLVPSLAISSFLRLSLRDILSFC